MGFALNETSPMQSSQLSVVIPAFNEEGSIGRLIKRLDQVLTLRNITYEIIVIDDNSTDATYPIVKDLSADYPVRVYRKRGSQGKAISLLEGFGYAQNELIAHIDADLQYPPEALPYMVDKINQGYDIVIGNRTEQQTSFLRKILSHAFHLAFVRWLHGLDYDTQSGLKLFRRKLLSDLHLKPTAWTFDLEFLLQARHYAYKITNYDIVYRARLADKSKISALKASFEIGLNALRLKFRTIQPRSIPQPTFYNSYYA
jgi:dolichol-phosphate mannosyltransferase